MDRIDKVIQSDMQDVCHTMVQGEILHAEHPEYPLYHAVIYGDKVHSAKLSKRLSCAIRHLPIRVSFAYETDTLKAIEKGITTDPTLTLEGTIFLEGLVRAEEISEAFEKRLASKEMKDG